MTQVRDNIGNTSVSVGAAPAEADVQGTDAPQGISDATVAERHSQEVRDENHDRHQAFQADFAKKLDDPPGYGANETEDAKVVKKSFAAAGMEVPTGPVAQQVHAAIGQSPSFNDMTTTLTKAMSGEGPVPTSAELKSFVDNTLGPMEEGGGTGVKGIAKLPYTTSATTLVMLAILQSQTETTKEKGDVLRAMKMYNGMTGALNKLTEQNLMPALKKIEDLKNQNKDKKDFDATKIQVPVNMPTSIDTENASLDQSTGEVMLNAEWGDGVKSSRQLVGSEGLQQMIQQVDSWRTSINNNQQRQSNRFTAKDNQSSSGYNILNAVLKNAHDAVSAVVHNV